ncbi:fimbrial protein [Rahnella sp. PCH160]|uniref:fimbrial protein n=1 Tax=Rahnella sp. PCH160 TaxID=3447928 RepID=UPI0039FBB540
MKMRKTLLCSTLLISSMFSSLSIADIPNQVLLHYTGTIVSQPCDISIGATTTLDLGDLDIATLSEKNSTSPWLNYNIKFSHCDVSTNILVGSSAMGNTWSYTSNTFGVFDSQSKLLSNIGLKVMTTVADKDIDMYTKFNATGGWIVITPMQRLGESATSYNLPIKFSFMNLTGVAPQPGGITGVYTIVVEYK